MKKINALSLFFVLGSAQLYSANVTINNPQLGFVLAYDSIGVWMDSIASDNDDKLANKLLTSMTTFLTLGQSLQQQLTASQTGLLFKGKPLDSAKIEMEDTKLQSEIDSLARDIHVLSKTGTKRKNRERSRDAAKNQLKANKENLALYNTAQSKQAQVNALIQQNLLAFEQAVESYINEFGQCYVVKGTISNTTIISSKYNKQLPITPNEYKQLITILNTAATQFGSSVSIMLPFDNDPTTKADDTTVTATISQVASYINNMAPSSPASYTSYAALGIGALTIAAAIGAAVAYPDETANLANNIKAGALEFFNGQTGTSYSGNNNLFTEDLAETAITT